MRIGEGRGTTAVASDKLAVQVARRVEHEILERGWPLGEVLGSETELRERFGVSRSILREAVRLLEHSHVAHMRQGPGGGLVVCSPDPRPAIRALVIWLEYVGATVNQVINARRIFEQMTLIAAAESSTESQIQELRANATGHRAGHPDEFHATLGRLSANPVLEVFINVLTRMTASHHRRTLPFTDEDITLSEVATEHLAIADAIAAGDSMRAHSALLRHLDDTSARLNRFVDPIPGTQSATRPMDSDPEERPREKRAAALAGRIHDDIVNEGRHVGEIIGSETDLLTRYQISRSIFREAVRILEHYSVARMRRGPGGGLVILAPDPTSSIRTVALYLAYRRPSTHHLQTVRTGLELGCLSAAMRSGSLTRADLCPDESTLLSSVGHCYTLRDRLAALSHDPVLTLLRSVLSTFWHEYGHHPAPDCAVLPHSHTHDELDAIIDAITTGDEPLAHLRLRNHLRTHHHW